MNPSQNNPTSNPAPEATPEATLDSKFIPEGDGWGFRIAEDRQLDIFRATCGDIMLVYHNGDRTSHIRLSEEAAKATFMGLAIVIGKHPINRDAPAAA
jgi:hypothetical protein